MTGLTDLEEMLATLEPVLREGEYVFVSLGTDDAALPGPRRRSGRTRASPRCCAEPTPTPRSSTTTSSRWITLTVHSSLAAVGLTAAFATALGDEGISCNVLAGYHHDHILVGADDADRAMAALTGLSRR